MRADGSTVVIGLGSPLMGDDGVGLVALERLRERWSFDPPVELLDGGTWGMNLLPFIEGAEGLVFLDAVEAGEENGRVVRLDRDELPRFFATKLSPHQIDLKEVLALAELRGTLPGRTVVLGVQPATVALSDALSGEVARALDRLLGAVVELLR
ncbi:MAG: hydrogenase maturation protease, partial [Gemmatimonadetes bacterium]|nr:hydrogenase maturation protease [Gemmatimonadota bacterium]NIQ58201.1 hydrogenase maturation protease [Gemmatimonadota bacterium]NIU78407.1 hydrogenase maturation protease [Gammaproteobacteria bacterium]NIX47331.1 hydrogenase maturation protease [Gemmatimonadota bacterium]NIY11707.1 hydrogenase maturation protease [Gemmatimonadota bacterium]